MQTDFNTYLANDYGALRRYVGEVRFNALAAECMAAYPVANPNQRSYSSKLPEWIAGFQEYAPELPELAALERAMRNAAEAADSPILAPTFAEKLSPEAINSVSFKLHPSVQLFTFTQNTVSIWSSLRCNETPPRPYRLDLSQHAIVWRQGSISRIRTLGVDEYLALAAVQNEYRFDELCRILATRDREEEPTNRAMGYLRGWLEADVLTGASVKGATK
jgi:Putative DNA-binding domain